MAARCPVRYSHGLREIGRVTETGGAEIGVYRRNRDGRVCLDDLHTGLFDPAEARDRLRELLDRAAMPGQEGRDDGEAAVAGASDG